MINHSSLIQAINNRCKLFFLEGDFRLNLYSSSKDAFYYRIDGYSLAINHRKNDKEQINVLKWFKSFWIYLEIKFIDKDIFISLSIFQGENSDDKKHQLFRLEWDDRENHIEKHPQPHWHITTDFAIAESYKEFANAVQNETFETFELVKSEIIDIKKIHFAMNGNWYNQGEHIHKLDNEEKTVNWIQGVLKHLRTELDN